jgi:sigma-B regulation protein RsbU (phosphoserine phosphatase)
LLYTDGVTESWNADGDEYGVDRLKAVMQQSGGLEPRQLTAACAADVKTFSGKGPQRDDLTIMTIRRLS